MRKVKKRRKKKNTKTRCSKPTVPPPEKNNNKEYRELRDRFVHKKKNDEINILLTIGYPGVVSYHGRGV